MRVLIPGGTGFLGRALAGRLQEAGYEVIVLSRQPERARLPPGVQAVRWDGRTAAGWASLADGAFAIINLAGESIGQRWTEAVKRRIRESRLQASQAVVEALAAASTKPQVLLQSSAVGYYGPRGDEQLTEEDPPGTDFLARLAVEWEASTQPVEAMGVRRVILRTGVVLERDGGALAQMLLPFRLFLGGPLGDGRQGFSWIHRADWVEAVKFLMEHPEARGPYNLTAPRPVRNAEFARILGRVLGRPSWLPVPAFALRLAFGEGADFLLTGQFVRPRRLLEAGFRFRYPDLESALRAILQRDR
ncbi:TIGR01777 family oxidoreductase [Thermoflexus sp.]|uniref:TIGR01777 family oxidoreductase n=1 Tax=Thermoflexus sp. TaxID=1969742 RepID=UPI0025CC39B2|nr:TIGR01777 family oxidoreductase [Thermoflexus sp.]MDW8181282.1 TIGR01777 family oxidoreductase [Anaerolineae bacterium]MCS6964584.1 TIGR01777 family oxidoreductase [Thermoflexus sp.]MCS7351823.1 TIGR01777 family oxidoreductase [Thermoflexus sp.]MCX7690980.1 TIGR01777 family oxidoreductase [Thermoflexus sp.]MDW8184104.1 TIGR01777 family oxidoreductase [Anaerolineae bacterium]